MSQVETTARSPTPDRQAHASRRSSGTSSGPGRRAVVFSLGADLLPADHDVGACPSFWLYFAEQKLGWQGPTDFEALLELPDAAARRDPPAPTRLLAPRRDRDGPHAPGRSSRCSSAAAIMQNWRTQAPRESGDDASDRRVSVGAMPFTKTEVDIHEDYILEAVDPAWLAQGVKSPKHLMLDPDNCILCRACEDVCPWNCIYMLSPGIVEGAEPTTSVERRGRHRERDLRRRRQRVHAMLGVRGPVPHRHAVLCAAARGLRRQAARWPRSPTSQAAEDEPVGDRARGGDAVKLKPPSPSELGDRLRETEVWKSIFRPGSIFRKGYKDTSRDRALATMNNVLYHLHPVKVKRHGLKLTYTFCLGGLSFFLFILLTITGIFLMFFYRPDGRHRRRAGLHRHAEHPDVGVLRRPRPQPPPVGRAPHGLQRDAAHGAGLLHRRVQAAARVQLGRRRDPAVPHARPVVHRLPAAVGPARDLGGHRRHVARGVLPVHREAGQLPAARRRRGRARRRCCAGTCCTCSRCRSSW